MEELERILTAIEDKELLDLRPNFFIVGAPKSGTTSMNNYLEQHPQIYMQPAVESHYLSEKYVTSKPVHNLEEYLKLFKSGDSFQIRGEKCVFYLYEKKVAKKIKTLNSNSKILIMLRNPVEMVYSLFNEYKLRLKEDIEDFQSAIEASKERSRGNLLPKAEISPKRLNYIKLGKYYEFVQNYLSVFENKNLKVIIFDKFKNETKKVYREVLNFLEVDDEFTPNFQRYNQNETMRSNLLGKILFNPPNFIRWGVRKVFTPEQRAWILKRAKAILSRPTERDEMEPRMRKKLKNKFYPSINKLDSLLTQDLESWM